MLGLFAAPITQAIVLYCGYKSFKAIESDKGQDDTSTSATHSAPTIRSRSLAVFRGS
jgi:hypothetical protein